MAATIRCPECGASIRDDSKFCQYCGGKLPDDTKRIEVKIDKRIEDVAEVKRAEYEGKESDIRAKKMRYDLRMRKIKFWTLLIWFGAVVVLSVPWMVNSKSETATTMALIALCMLAFSFLILIIAIVFKK